MLKPRQAPPVAAGPTPENPSIVSIEGGATKGSSDARVTLVEFTDYQCPFCSRHFRDTMPQIDNDYVKTGKIRYVLREFPLESIHPLAFKAAEAANCSGEQGKYWEMHDRLFANQNALAAQQLPSHADAVGLDGQKFKTCLDSGKYAAKLRKDLADAQGRGYWDADVFHRAYRPQGFRNKGCEKDCWSPELRCIQGCYRYSTRGTMTYRRLHLSTIASAGGSRLSALTCTGSTLLTRPPRLPSRPTL